MAAMRSKRPAIESKPAPAARRPNSRRRPWLSPASSMDLLERVQSKESDAPLCFTCGTEDASRR